MKSQVLTLEYVLLFSLILIIVATTYIWSVPVVDEALRNAELNRVGNGLANLDRTMREVSHQPGAIRTLEIDLGDGSLSIAPPLIIYTTTIRNAEPSPRVTGLSPIRLFLEDYNYTVTQGRVEITGLTLLPGAILQIKNGFVQLEDEKPTFALLSGKTLPARKSTKEGDGYRVELFLSYDFSFEGRGSRTGKALLHISNQDGVVKVEF